MPLGSYRVLSEHKYIGLPTGRIDAVRHINQKDIKSMQGETLGTHFTKEGVVRRTANNRFVTSYRDFGRNGYFSQVDDYGMGRWIKAGNDNPPSRHSLIPKMPDFGYITGVTPVRMDFHNPSDTPVNLHTRRSVLNAVDPNRLGYSHSKLENFSQDLRNLMFDKANRLNYEAVEYLTFLDKKGFSIDTTPNPGIVGLGVEKGDFLAAYYHKQGYLIREQDFLNRAKNLISRYGLTDKEAVEGMKRSVLLHEFGHVLGIGGDRKDEKLQGELQAEFYSVMAERFKGTKMERIYRALAREGRDYAKERSSSLLELIASDERSTTDGTIEQIHAKFEAEAMALGLRGTEFARYVNKRIQETYGAIIDGEPSYKESERKSKSSTSRNLEERVEENEEGTKSDSEYKSRITKSDYKSMKDVREREAKSEKAENDAKAEAAEAPASS